MPTHKINPNILANDSAIYIYIYKNNKFLNNVGSIIQIKLLKCQSSEVNKCKLRFQYYVFIDLVLNIKTVIVS